MEKNILDGKRLMIERETDQFHEFFKYIKVEEPTKIRGGVLGLLWPPRRIATGCLPRKTFETILEVDESRT